MARAVARTPKRSALELQTSAISTPVRSPQCCDLVPSLQIRVLEFIEDFLDKFFEDLNDLLVQLISCLLLVDEGLRGGGLAVVGLQRNPLGEDLVLLRHDFRRFLLKPVAHGGRVPSLPYQARFDDVDLLQILTDLVDGGLEG